LGLLYQGRISKSVFRVSAIILGVISLIMGLRVDEEQEQTGLDMALHQERGYII